MNDNVFIDTNILVYAHDKDAGLKHSKASQIVATFWEQRQRPFISTQVLQELHVNLLSEDLNAGQDYGSIVVLNPFN